MRPVPRSPLFTFENANKSRDVRDMRPLALILVLVGAAFSQAPTPCGEILRFEPRDPRSSDRWHAVLDRKTADLAKGAVLRIELDNPANAHINWYGGPSQGTNCNVTNANRVASSDKPLKIGLKCNKPKKIPNVTKIWLNGAVICSSPGQVSVAQSSRPPASPSRPPAQPSRPSVAPVRPFGGVSVADIFPNEGEEGSLSTDSSGHKCGIVPLTGRPLVYNGVKAEDGRWPWHIAIQKLTGATLAYSCGGTLISHSFAVTAAHCVVRLPTKNVLNPQVFLIQLGTNDLKNGGEGLQNLQASKIFVHPDFDPRRYYNDIALIKFTRSIEYTDYIQPVCLWQGNNDIHVVQGQLGTVVGWGVDTNNATATDLLETRIPVVSLSTCIYSNRDFYAQYTSESTFCAGYTNGTTVCRGDSGGGMVFPMDGTSKQTWQLRGVVSVSPNPGTRACATDSYVVFTDVAKHLTWIKTTAQLF